MHCKMSCSSLAASWSVWVVENAQPVASQGCGAISRSEIDAISDMMRFQNVLIDDGRVSMVEHWLD